MLEYCSVLSSNSHAGFSDSLKFSKNNIQWNLGQIHCKNEINVLSCCYRSAVVQSQSPLWKPSLPKWVFAVSWWNSACIVPGYNSKQRKTVSTHSLPKCDFRVSVSRYLVKGSEQFSAVWTFCVWRSPRATKSCIYTNLNSTCLVFFPEPNIVAMLFPAVLSV